MPLKKTYRIKRELHCILLLSFFLVLIISAGGAGWLHYLRVALGLPFVLFFPGYTLIAALFPRKEDLDGIERVALSFGLSIAVVPLIGLGLNYTPWGIRLAPILISLILFILAMSTLAFYRRGRLPEEERFFPVFTVNLPLWREMSRLDRVLTLVLVLAILFAAGSVYYVVTTPKVGEKFTEFYILGMGGKAEGYPRDLTVGEKGRVMVGVVNHEYQPVNYYIELRMGGNLKSIIGPFTLSHEQKWENPVSFFASQPHKDLKVEFLLFRQGDREPYRTLHLWVNVHGRENQS